MLPYYLEFSHRLAGIATPLILGGATLYFAIKRLRYDKEALRVQRDTDLIKWHGEALSICALLEELCKNGKELSCDKLNEKILENLSKLSGLIDQGRMFLPNSKSEQYGSEKEEAFKDYEKYIS